MAQVLCPVLVGRDAELRALDAALAAAMAGRGGCAVITGEPGIGKSRLAREAAVRAAERGIRVITGRACRSRRPCRTGRSPTRSCRCCATRPSRTTRRWRPRGRP